MSLKALEASSLFGVASAWALGGELESEGLRVRFFAAPLPSFALALPLQSSSTAAAAARRAAESAPSLLARLGLRLSACFRDFFLGRFSFALSFFSSLLRLPFSLDLPFETVLFFSLCFSFTLSFLTALRFLFPLAPFSLLWRSPFSAFSTLSTFGFVSLSLSFVPLPCNPPRAQASKAAAAADLPSSSWPLPPWSSDEEPGDGASCEEDDSSESALRFGIALRACEACFPTSCAPHALRDRPRGCSWRAKALAIRRPAGRAHVPRPRRAPAPVPASQMEA
mmetsp:Transcript_130167/g.324559  ORF Transcript_130167/g.324559 Transcript_130167/m.324559 type:complete len:281 (-) Transcript_130167:7-849(-)